MIASLRTLFAANLKTTLLSIIFFLLPWQTRLIVGQATITGDATPFGVISVYAVEVLVLATALLTLVRAKDRPRMEKSYRVPLLLALAIFVIAALSLLWSSQHVVSLNMLFHLGCAMTLFALMLDRHVRVQPLLLSFVVGLMMPMAIGIWQAVADASPASTVLGLASRDADALGDAVTVGGDGARQLRAYGSFSHPNIFGGYLAVGLLACAALLREVKKPKYLLLIPLVFAVLLALTASRAAILGLVLGMFLAGLVARMKNTAKARILVIPIALVVIGAALLGSLYVPNIAASLRGGGATEDASIVERLIQYANYPRVVGDAWLLGNGLGTYAFVAADVEPGLEVWDYQPIHNVPLLIIGELGLLGALIVFAWSSSIDRMNFNRFPNRDALAAFAMGNVVLVILFFDHWIWSQWSGLALIALVMALTVRMGEAK